MANSFRHDFEYGAGPTKVSGADWDAEHVVTIDTVKAQTSTPGVTANLDVWWEVTGTSPNEVWILKGRNASGTIRTLHTVTF